MCLGMIIFVFILLEVYWPFWINVINSRKDELFIPSLSFCRRKPWMTKFFLQASVSYPFFQRWKSRLPGGCNLISLFISVAFYLQIYNMSLLSFHPFIFLGRTPIYSVKTYKNEMGRHFLPQFGVLLDFNFLHKPMCGSLKLVKILASYSTC